MKSKTNKNSLFSYLIGASLCCFFQQAAFGQSFDQIQEEKSEISLHAGGVFSSLDYDLQGGNINRGSGGLLGVRYAHYFNPHWSLGLGVEYAAYKSTATLGTIRNSYNAADSEGENFEFRYRAKNYREEQSARFVQIPLTVQYETEGVISQFYVSLGAKIALPISAEYQSFSSEISTSGYYAQYDAELFDPKFAGFANFGRIASPEQELELKPAYIATIEFGLKQKAGNKSWIYIGFFLDYGLNDIYDGETGSGQLVGYGERIPSQFSYDSLLKTGAAENLKVMAFGVKLRYAFGF